VSEARQAMAALNERNGSNGRAPLNYGIGVHVGDVMYGNIGSRARLDFTVIGPAVNLTSRVEAVAKAINVPIIVTDSFATAFEGPLISLGQHRLRGLSAPHELFAPLVPGHPKMERAPGHDAPASSPLAETTES